MELRHLTVFVAVAEEGGFTRAADRLHVVQSAVSASVRALERELGVTLFDRSTHHVALSDAGEALLPQARATLAAADAAREAVDEVRGGLRGTLTIGVMQAPAMRALALPTLVAGFRARHPRVEVRIRHGGGSAYTADLLREGRLDVGILALPERRAAGLTLTELHSEPMALLCTATHPLAGRADVELAALVDETFADTPEGWGTRMATDRAFGAAGVRRRVTYELDDTASMVEFVAQGLAVALLPPMVAGTTPGLVAVPIRHHAPVFRTSVAISSERRLGAAARAFLQDVLRGAGLPAAM